MTTRPSQPPDSAARYLRWAAILFAVGWGLHVLDHLRRGMSASLHAVMVGGMIQGLFVVAAVVMTLSGRPQRRWAPDAAIVVGFGPRINVTWFSWLSALTEIGTGIVFAIADLRTRRCVDGTSPLVLRHRTQGDISP